jgi:hypothetical protein
MTWTDVDGVRDYLGGRDRVSRKAVYRLVELGLKVARVSTTGPQRDRKGRLRQGRVMFALEWIDEFLEARASATGTPIERKIG